MLIFSCVSVLIDRHERIHHPSHPDTPRLLPDVACGPSLCGCYSCAARAAVVVAVHCSDRTYIAKDLTAVEPLVGCSVGLQQKFDNSYVQVLQTVCTCSCCTAVYCNVLYSHSHTPRPVVEKVIHIRLAFLLLHHFLSVLSGHKTLCVCSSH